MYCANGGVSGTGWLVGLVKESDYCGGLIIVQGSRARRDYRKVRYSDTQTRAARGRDECAGHFEDGKHTGGGRPGVVESRRARASYRPSKARDNKGFRRALAWWTCISYSLLFV